MSSLFNLIFIMSLTGSLIIADTPVAPTPQTKISRDVVAGYSALKLFLEDEQHLTTIRRAKMIITFSGISEHSTKLVDDIADVSASAIEELEKLSKTKPAFNFVEFSDDTIAKATIDSLRMTTAEDFLFAGDEFEKDLILSQLKILRVISHLASQLEKKEINAQRKKWLRTLADHFENHYQQVNASILVSTKI